MLSTLRWHGTSQPVAAVGTTAALPILLYHRVATDGPPELGRYRVSPDAFEEQLRLLARSGYRGITLAEWGRALRARRPVDGRAVALTFDDGYRDFLTTAWPLLRRYRFSATVFVVTDAVDSQQPGADVVPDGQALHALFIESSSRSIFGTTDVRGWQPSRLEVDGIRGSWVRGNIFVRRNGATVYGYVYDGGSEGGSGMNRYAEIVLRGGAPAGIR